jgi:hypothetical protein
LRIEALAELHDVHTFGTECRTDRWGRVSLAAFHLEFNINIYFFCHGVKFSTGENFAVDFVLKPLLQALFCGSEPGRTGIKRCCFS